VTRSIGVPLAAGLLSSLLFLSLAEGFAAGIVFSYIAPLPLMAVGLWRGTWAGLVAGLAAMAAVAGVAGVVSSLPFGIAVVLPSLVVVRQALLWRTNADGGVEWYPPGLVLGWLTAIAAALILIGAAMVSGTASGGEMGGVQAWVTDTIGKTLGILAPTLTDEQRHAALVWWVPLFPAMVAGSWVVMATANAAAAQGLLTRFGRNRRPTPVYRELALPAWLGAALAVASVMGGLTGGDLGYLARSVAVVTLMPFVLLGLAVVHGWAAGRPGARMLLAVVYGVLFLASTWALIPMAGLGLARFVTRFRPRPDGRGGKEE